ncbi:type II toxin-antitoxin system RelE/ParE family toxin [Taklimakanibacter deserti]|uniref:type II toxin-antitoxin system RelE/ParE family toxin n=1 Tax=Taklimakanibacter deserti TaxID=2267839 RepID=UPI000E646A00
MAVKGRVYKLSPLAEADLENIWLYTFQRWSLEQADSYHAAIVSAFEGLAAGTKRGRTVSIREGYFKYSVGSHLVFYKLSDTGIDVVRVLHQRMDIDSHL